MSIKRVKIPLKKHEDGCDLPDEVIATCITLGFDCDTKCWMTVPGMRFGAAGYLYQVEEKHK